jgi:hypothetical protein
MKQTAVEWLVSALDALDEQMKVAQKTTNYKSTRESIIKQAEEMEKEHFVNFYASGQFDTLSMFKNMKDLPAEFNQLITENFKDLV